MRALNLCSSLALLAALCTGCHRNSSPPAQAQAPPLQTGKGTLSPPKTSQQAEKTDTPLASPLPQPSAQSVPLPPPPPPKKVRHKVKPPPAKPADTAQTPAATTPGSTAAPEATTTPAESTAPQQQAAAATAASPIGQLTTGDSALGEKTKRETSDLINETQQGLNGIKRSLSTDEKTVAAQIRNYLKQAQQALDNGDTDGAHGLATKAKLLLDELTKP
jgi:outer membrane biosynthesis protein TonB